MIDNMWWVGHPRRYRPSGLGKDYQRDFQTRLKKLLVCVSWKRARLHLPKCRRGENSLLGVFCQMPQLCWVSSAPCVSRSAPLTHFCSAFNFTFGRRMCGLFWKLVRSIHRPRRGKQEQIWGDRGIGKKKTGKEGSGKRNNSITSHHFLYIVCWRFLGKSHALCIAFCLWMPFLLCAFNNFILIFLSSLLLEAAWLPLCCSTQALFCCHLLVIFMCSAMGIHILSSMSLVWTYQHYSCRLLDRHLWKLVNISPLL